MKEIIFTTHEAALGAVDELLIRFHLFQEEENARLLRGIKRHINQQRETIVLLTRENERVLASEDQHYQNEASIMVARLSPMDQTI